MNAAPCRARARGTALVETLLAAPVVLLLGLGGLQWALLFHARTAIEYGLFEAVRAGSVAQADPAAIESGLARGLMPYRYGVDAARPWAAAVAATGADLRQGLAAGWVVLRQLSPTLESFVDWGEPARDAAGHPLPGVVEIPNDSLQWSASRRPASGVAGMRGSEPVGARSQQTLNDANLLKLELRYGVPMSVPLAGRLAVWLMRIVDGCAAPSSLRLGSLALGTPAAAPGARAWACPIYLAPDASGVVVPRWPVRVSATLRMQSAARRSALTSSRTQSAVLAASSATASHASGTSTGMELPLLPEGGTPSLSGASAAPDSRATVTAPATPATPELPAASTTPAAPTTHTAPATPANDGSLARGRDGWLDIGGDRSFTVPGACL